MQDPLLRWLLTYLMCPVPLHMGISTGCSSTHGVRQLAPQRVIPERAQWKHAFYGRATEVTPSFPRHPLSYAHQPRLAQENRPKCEHSEMRVTGQHLKVWQPPAPTILCTVHPVCRAQGCRAERLAEAHGTLGGLRASGRASTTMANQKAGQVYGLELLEDKEDPQD